MAVGEPAHRAPTTMASYTLSLLSRRRAGRRPGRILYGAAAAAGSTSLRSRAALSVAGARAARSLLAIADQVAGVARATTHPPRRYPGVVPHRELERHKLASGPRARTAPPRQGGAPAGRSSSSATQPARPFQTTRRQPRGVVSPSVAFSSTRAPWGSVRTIGAVVLGSARRFAPRGSATTRRCAGGGGAATGSPPSAGSGTRASAGPSSARSGAGTRGRSAVGPGEDGPGGGSEASQLPPMLTSSSVITQLTSVDSTRKLTVGTNDTSLPFIVGGRAGGWCRVRHNNPKTIARQNETLTGPASGGQGVAPLDGGADAGAALARVEVGLLLHLGRGGGERVVLDRLAEPARVVALPQVVEPGRVVDALAELQEEDQVLGA